MVFQLGGKVNRKIPYPFRWAMETVFSSSVCVQHLVKEGHTNNFRTSGLRYNERPDPRNTRHIVVPWELFKVFAIRSAIGALPRKSSSGVWMGVSSSIHFKMTSGERSEPAFWGS
jgi:hypothetical protein